MFLPDFSIKRPVASTMMVSALVIFGFIGVSRLGISLFPDVDFPIITITTTWENARPEEVDNEITDKLEDAVSSVSEIKHISSRSMMGQSQIVVEFELSKNLDVASQEVRDKVSVHLSELPDDSDAPMIDKLDLNAQPIMWLAITGQYSIEYLTKIADEQIRPLLQKIQGVGEIRTGGMRKKQIKIWIYRERLAALNIGIDEVINAIKSQHIEIPGGKIETKEKEFLIRTIGELKTFTEFANLIVAYRKGTAIRLKQLGYVEQGREESIATAKFTTKEKGTEKTVALGVTPRSGANEVAIGRKVKKTLPQISKILPKGMHIYFASDNTKFIKNSINEIKFQLIVGAILAAFTILLFLQNFSTTLISAVAIPTSIVATFLCIYSLGFTLNNMTMLALVTSVGLVIDDAIVMVENIFRHRTVLGKDMINAAYQGSSEIAFAVVATTVALVGVFIPVAFMEGLVGQFISQFAITMAFAVACSTFIALTIVPMLSSRFLTLGKSKDINKIFSYFNKMMEVLSDYYEKIIKWLLLHRIVVVVIAFFALFLGGYLFTLVGKEFITAEDQSRFMVRMETPLSYSIDKTDEMLGQIGKLLNDVPEIKQFYLVAGWPSSNKGLAFVTMYPKNKRNKSQQEIQVQLRKALKQIPDVKANVSDISPFGAGRRNENIQFVIQGPDINAIDEYSRKLMLRLEQIKGYVGITRDLEIGKPEVRVQINREKAADAGISVKKIGTAVGVLLGGIDVAEYKEGGKTYDIHLSLVRSQKMIPSDVRRIWIRSENGLLMDISNFVKIKVGVGPNAINRLDRQRSATVYANLEGKLLGDAMPEIEKIANEFLPETYSTMFSGKAETFRETFKNIIFAFILAILITYMVLAAQFESFVQPFAIMLGLPLSFIGAFGMLFLLENSLNLYSMIGLILLVGLATKNGILLIDYTNLLRKEGMEVNEAIVKAGATRLRPILMTAVSTIAGVLPVAFGIGVGSESRQPMAVAISGGMLSSTLLTLIVVPVAYSYCDQLVNIKLFKRKIGTSAS